jgi:hypothetical protein
VKTLYVNRLTDKEIRQLAKDLVTGESFLVWANERYEVETCFGFMLSAVMASDDPPDAREFNRVGAFYAPMSAAMHLSVNGLPMFTQMRFLHKNDTKRLWERIEKIQAAMNGD